MGDVNLVVGSNWGTSEQEFGKECSPIWRPQVKARPQCLVCLSWLGAFSLRFLWPRDIRDTEPQQGGQVAQWLGV